MRPDREPTRPDRDDRTDAELIRRASELNDQDGWLKLVDRYGDLIRGRCLRRGIPPQEAEELAQSVWMKVFKRLPSFEYDPAGSFRRWLGCIADRKVIEHFRRLGRKPRPLPLGDLEPCSPEPPTTVPLATAGDGASPSPLARAEAVVQFSVQRRSWEAFQRVAAKGEPLSDVARDLGMKYSAAYMAVARIRRKLRDQLLRELGRP